MNDKKSVPEVPSLDPFVDGRGMDNRVEIGRYQVVCFDKDDLGPEIGPKNITDEEIAKIEKAPPISDYFKGWIGTPDWIIWEAIDGTLHVCNGRNEDGSVKGETVVVPRA